QRGLQTHGHTCASKGGLLPRLGDRPTNARLLGCRAGLAGIDFFLGAVSSDAPSPGASGRRCTSLMRGGSLRKEQAGGLSCHGDLVFERQPRGDTVGAAILVEFYDELPEGPENNRAAKMARVRALNEFRHRVGARYNEGTLQRLVVGPDTRARR